MNTVRLAVRQALYENRAFWRNPAAAFFTFFFPLMFLVLFNLLFGNDTFDITPTGPNAATVVIQNGAASCTPPYQECPPTAITGLSIACPPSFALDFNFTTRFFGGLAPCSCGAGIGTIAGTLTGTE